MPEIDVQRIDGKYHLWIEGEPCGVYDSLNEVSDVFKSVEEEQNERNGMERTD